MVEGVVEVTGGRLQGVHRAGVWSFSGVPYASAPTGDRRWRPPVAPSPWTGVRECDAFGPIAPQMPPIAGMSVMGEPEARDEDCLTLNIWTPATDTARRPVMVWIHGGGFTSGSGAGNLYRGGALVRDGDVVVVTCNYRLGALGWLAHPALAEGAEGEPWIGDGGVGGDGGDGGGWHGWGNWGLADQIAVLVWVRDNIAAFGGDPANVTVFGESAGGMSVSALLAAPAARGLFHRAAVQSGPPYTHDVDAAVAAAERLAGKLDVPLTRAALAAVPAEAFVTAAAELASSLRIGDGLPLPFLPAVDGGVLDTEPLAAVEAGSAAAVPLLAGTTRDEAAFFAVSVFQGRDLERGQLVEWVARGITGEDGTADRAAGLLDAYASARRARGEPVAPRDLWTAVVTDTVFRLPTLRLADAHRAAAAAAAAGSAAGTFTYLFTWETPAFGGLLGSCHALEIPFVFGTVAAPAIQLFTGGGDDAQELSAAMRAGWTSLARHGHPGTDWPVWEPIARPTRVFGPWPGADGMARTVERPRDEELEALAVYLGPQHVR